MKILIADQNVGERTLLAQALRPLNHQVVEAANGLEVLDQIESSPDIRLIVADSRLPGLDGAELCRRVRARDNQFYTYLILMDSGRTREGRLAGLMAGADDLMTRPIDASELTARLEIGRRILGMQTELIRRSLELESLRHELEQHNALLADLALTDPLTGLRNRRHFHQLFDTHFTTAARLGEPLTVILMDVDNFKSYNDTFGHPAGDSVLTTVGEILRANVRDRDLVARYGGEEFVVLLPGGGPEEGIRLAERLRKKILKHQWPDVPVTASFGVATMNSHTPIPTMLLDRADRALYFSKRNGRNRVTHERDVPASGDSACSPLRLLGGGSGRVDRDSVSAKRRASACMAAFSSSRSIR